MKKIIFYILLIISTLCFAYTDYGFTIEEKTFLANHPTIRVSNELDWAPFDFASAGVPQGFSIDLIKLIADRAGFEIDFINGYSWNTLSEMFYNDEIDVMHPIYITEERKQIGVFSNTFYSSKTHFITRNDKNSVQNIKDLKGKTIAVAEGWVFIKFIKENFPSINIVECVNIYDALVMLDNEKADAVIELRSVAKYHIEKHSFIDLKIGGWFQSYEKSSPRGLHYFAKNKNKEIISIINKTLKSIPLSEISKMKDKYSINSENITKVRLTAKEKEFLSKHKEIVLGIDKGWDPYINIRPDGSYDGFDQEIVNLINQATGAKIRLKIGVWKELLKEGEKRVIDGLSTSVAHEERRKYYNFSAPYITTQKMIIGFKNQESAYNDIDDLAGKTIIVMKGNLHDTKLAKSIPHTKIKYANTVKGLVEALSRKEADVTIGGLYLIYIANKMGMKFMEFFFPISEPTGFVYSIRNDWPEALSIINKGISSIPRETRSELIEKWFTLRQNISATRLDLTEEEKKYLSRNEIKYCIDPFWEPYEKLDRNNQHAGMSKDYITLIEKKLNVKFKFIPTKDWRETLQKARNGDCDFLSALSKTPARSEFLGFTGSYISVPNVIVTKSDVNFIDDIKFFLDKKFAVIEGYAIAEYLKSIHPNIQLIYTKNAKEGLLLVERGQAFGFIDAIPTISHIIQLHSMDNLKITGDLNYLMDLRVGVSKENKILLSIMKKAVKSITEKEHQDIRNKYGTVKYTINANYAVVWRLTGVIIIIIALISYWNRKLADEIKEKEKVENRLKNKNLELEDSYIKLNEMHIKTLELEKKNSALAMAVTANHELNQPLMVLSANLEMLIFTLESEPTLKQQKYLDNIESSLERIRSTLEKYKSNHSINFEEYTDDTEMIVYDE